MEVKITHKVDSGEKNTEGVYDFHYEYDVYKFIDNRTCFVARSYNDEPSEVHFMKKVYFGQSGYITDGDLTSPLFIEATKHLKSMGKIAISYLTKNGYITL